MDKSILIKARILFIFLLFIYFTAVVSATTIGIKSGEISTKIIEPVKIISQEIGKSIATNLDQADKMSTNPTNTVVITNSTTTVNTSETNHTAISSPATGYRYKYPSPSPVTRSNLLYSSEEYDKAKAEQDTWWQQVQKEFQDTAAKNKAEVDAFGQQAQQDMTNFQKESQAKIEQWKKDNNWVQP